ncbi:MAG: beta-lactamase family protein [Candidatus Aminicenantes bacterium]|nr:beta-lactamase family protein [Candidatus Aminicenantes bacterium]
MQGKKYIKKGFIAFIGVLFLVFFVQCAFKSFQEKYISNEVKDSIKKRVDNAESVGIVVGIINADGKTESFCYGTMGLDDDRPVDEHSVYEIGSISKVFTCTVLADMIEEKTLDLTDPADMYLPQRVTLPLRNGMKITLEHLATHTSSLPRMPSNYRPADPLNPYADYTVQNLYDFLSQCTLTRDIGSEYEYSNLAMGLLGHILSLKAGVSYEDMIVERICRPLGMESTVISLSPELKKRLAKPHNAKGEVSLWDIPTLAGAGAIRSTADDMLAFLYANMGLKQTELLPAMEMAHEPRVDAGEDMHVGLGWHIRDNGQTKIVWHNGGTGGYRTFAGFVKDKKIGVIVLSNMNIGQDDIGFHLLDNSYKLKSVEDIFEVEPQILNTYAGEYKIKDSDEIHYVTRRGRQLILKSPEQRPIILFPKSETEFKIKFSTMRIAFKGDDSGEIIGMMMLEPAKKIEAMKLK